MTEPADVIVTAADMFSVPFYSDKPGHCRGGARLWFQRHGLDFRAFVRDGLPASVLEATGCEFARGVVQWARQRAARECLDGQ